MRSAPVAALAGILLLGGLLVATPRAARADDAPPAAADSVILIADLAGAAEVPGPGDPDGAGFAFLVLDPAAGEICYTLTVRDVAPPPAAAHLHHGGADTAGPVVVSLAAPDGQGLASACATGLDPALVHALADAPADFYVNVHTAAYPNGAVRGQLRPYDPTDGPDGDE